MGRANEPCLKQEVKQDNGIPDKNSKTSGKPRRLVMRKYLKRAEVVTLIANAQESGRNGARDALMISMMFKHGLRVSELCDLRWGDIDFTDRTILCRRMKQGVDALHPLSPDEVQQLTQLYAKSQGASRVFLNERGRPMLRQRVHEIVKNAAVGLPINVHCHVLRHSTCAALVKARMPIRNIQSFVGHASLSSTLIYSHLDETRFAGIMEALA
jgi:site-specific recombinase XerD